MIMIKFNGVEIFTVEELHENVQREKDIKANKIALEVKRMDITEWDDTVSNVEVTVFDSIVIVRYDDGTAHKEDRARFEAGKWAESEFMERFAAAWNEQARLQETIRRYTPTRKNIDWVIVERYGDTCRVRREDLRIKEVVTVSTEHEIIMMAEMEDGEILDVLRFYPDEIWISTYEIAGKTLKEALDVKEYKDRMYLGQW
jgi:hypothetical protein